MTQQEELLRQILENPNDTDCRLVYADWLQEHDQDARAKFVRVQIKLHQLGIGRGYKPCREITQDGTDIDALREQEQALWVGGACFSILDEVRPFLPEQVTVYKLDEKPRYQTQRSEAYVSRGFIESWSGLRRGSYERSE